MASSSRLANNISSIASVLHFLVIIFQIPLFRVPCSSGICRTPVEVTSSQFLEYKILPVVVVQMLLFPGALANAIIGKTSIPSFSNLLDLYNLNSLKGGAAAADIQRLEILAGSYLSVTGAILGLLEKGKLSLFGMLLLLWSLINESIRQKPTIADPNKITQIHPTMFIAVLIAMLCVKGDVRKIVRFVRVSNVAKPMNSSFKFKII